MKYDLLAYIGRFQPFHLGHEMVIKEALQQAERLVILIGSTNQARTPKNPWTFEERVRMIKSALSASELERITFEPLRDRLYNEEQWIEGVQRAVHRNRKDAKKISIVGYTKDGSSYYLRKFPQWAPHVEVAIKEPINATDLRNAYLSGDEVRFETEIVPFVPKSVVRFLEEFRITPEYQYLISEQAFLNKHKDSWKSAPYKPTFNCADAVVVQSGHVLLIQRKSAPGKDLWAIPGGHLDDRNFTYADCAIRELLEETKIDVLESVLRQRIKDEKIFSHPERSLRGRYITGASLIHLEQHGPNLPKIKGSDDARKAKWFTFAQFRQMEPVMFEDHYAIVEYFINKL